MKQWDKLLLGAALLLTAFVVLVAAMSSAVPSPLELREFGFRFPTDELVRGGNPYRAELQPAHGYFYGVLYHLVAWPFAKAVGSTFMLHRLLSLSFLVLGGVALFRAMALDGVAGWKALFCACTCVIILGNGSFSVSCRPDSLGWALMMLAFWIAQTGRCSTRSLISVAVVIALASLTKAYFIVGLGVVSCVAWNVRGPLRATAFFLCGLTLCVLAALATDWWLPGYWDQSVVNLTGMLMPSWTHLARSGITFMAQVQGWAFLVALGLWHCIRKDGLASCLQLIKTKSLPVVGIVVSLAVLIGSLGRHQGNSLLYWNHLLMPFLAWQAARVWQADLAGPWARVALGILLAGVATQVPSFPRLGGGDWEVLKAEVAQAPVILSHPVAAQLLDADRKEVADTGLTEFSSLMETVKPSRTREFFKHVNAQHRAELRERLEAGYYDLVLTYPGGTSPFFEKATVEKRYRMHRLLQILSWKNRVIPVELWQRKPDGN